MAETLYSYRTIFLSDVHLGTKACQAEFLLEFLKVTEAETIYLVGDIVDGWRLKKTWYWPQAHNDVVQKLLRKARKGTKVIFIPGNHDEFAREFIGTSFGDVPIVKDAIHEAADGKSYLVIHGDEFDVVVRHAQWLAHIGDWAYVTLLAANTWLNRARRRLGLTYWSLSAYLKHKTKRAVEFIGRFEEALADEARRREVDGVICGHIHTAEQKMMGDVIYCNDGDWVESCTALVEHFDGRMEIVTWTDMAQQIAVGQKTQAQPGLTGRPEPAVALASPSAAE